MTSRTPRFSPRTASDTAPKSQAARDPRAERLKAAMKANIAKRKAQARARGAQSASGADANDNADKQA
ncbi:hypothetical protein [Roseibaca sp. Y0-43]|uniref:hypothetical protein n=1 Tax=Roseibaca sp. Y0-43 TaxID=2816854 RepID=UPI001D0CD45C|nr:hypothetical protein [Roseibaca sp. Y0-43]MCC1480754.1 hypothetical protein [Roseibaca sp. Y0-43]